MTCTPAPIGSTWAPGSWADTAWCDGSWGPSTTPTPQAVSGSAGLSLFPSALIYDDEEALLLVIMEALL